MIMKIGALAILTVFALASTAYASATYHKHHHHHTAKINATAGVTTGMAPSGPSLYGGRRDESRPGGRGVSRKPSS
jgi:hypothetical protein